jgi:Sulfotransferase family
MANIVCHLGLHKTASGTLQRQFFPACSGLNLLTTLDPAVRQFVHAVTRKDPLYFDPNHALELLGGRVRSDQINLLSNESLSGPPYAGLSEGGLDHRSPVLQNLKAVFPNARVVVVLRRQDSLARSLYRQYLKRGGTAKVQNFFGTSAAHQSPLMSLDRFCFSPYVHCVYETFGSHVLVLTFEEFLRDQRLFLERLCHFIGAKRPDIKLDPENATRMGPTGMEVTRLLNFAFRGMLNQGIVPRLPVRRRGHWRRVSPVELIHDYWPGRPGAHQDSALNRVTNDIWQRYREDNRRLDHEYRLGLGELGYY